MTDGLVRILHFHEKAPHLATNFIVVAPNEKRQHGVCPLCKAHFELSEMEADHITPWRDGGRTIPSNCQMLCKDCNRRKSAK